MAKRKARRKRSKSGKVAAKNPKSASERGIKAAHSRKSKYAKGSKN